MNQLSQSLAAVCREHLLTEKWLLAPSYRVGHQWMETVVRAGQPIVNLHVKTVEGLSVDLVAGKMAEKQYTRVSRDIELLMVEEILHERPSGEWVYFREPSSVAGLAEALLRTIESLRQADVTPDSAGWKDPLSAAKARDVAFVLDRLQARLESERYTDRAEIYRWAIDALRTNSSAIDKRTLILLPEDLEQDCLSRRFVQALPQDQLLLLKVDGLERASSESWCSTGLERLGWLSNVSGAPPAPADDTVRLSRAVGEVNEVRQVIRACVHEEHLLDGVELIHTDSETYVPLVLDALISTGEDEGVSLDQLPVTIAEGIPCHLSRPGRALARWLEWVGADHPQTGLVSMLSNRLLATEESNGQLIRSLMSVVIGEGSQRYLPRIDQAIELTEKELTSDETKQHVRSDQGGRLEENLEQLRAARSFVAALLAISPTATDSPAQILKKATLFLEQFSHRSGKLDEYALQRFLLEIKALSKWIGSISKPPAAWNAMATLRSLPDRLRVMGSGPQPGCLHVAHINSGGHSGRAMTFIVGLDDRRFPGLARQDPILLDHERRSLSADLPTAAARLEETTLGFARLLARLRGRVAMSYSCRDLAEDREMYPSSVLLDAHRLLTNRMDADLADFDQALGSGTSFSPEEEAVAASKQDWWLWRLFGGEPIADAQLLVESAFPHLRDGRRAKEARESESFTAYDGFVPEAGKLLDPTHETGPVMSANSLETLGTCPLRFFFQRGLKISPPEDLSVDRQRWLDPMTFGSLLHKLFEQFFQRVIDNNDVPTVIQHHSLIHDLLDALIQDHCERIPPPSTWAFERQISELKAAAEIFLREEERLCREINCRPTFLEASVGIALAESNTAICTTEPVMVKIGNKRIRVRGRIDRVDSLEGGGGTAFSIWDYKTGSDYGFDASDPFGEGRLLQPFLYACVAEHRLRKVVDAKSKILRFGYFFPGRRTAGKRIEWDVKDLRDGETIVDRLCQLAATGAFIPTDNEEDCKFCDYASACGDIATSVAQSEIKIKNTRNRLLRPMRELRHDL
jgi:ATP-dependent helicase/nuclease subunit B